jgi:prepilin-type N-terminal cleavage/methylation domain-containing protein
MIRRRHRQGYTLLELILALAIGLMLMSALYVTLSSQLANFQAGRDSIQEAKVVQGIVRLITDDVAASLGTYDIQKSTTSSSASAAAAASQPMTSSAVVFNYGVEGDDSNLTLNVARAPRELLSPDKLRLETSTLPTVSGLRRMTYWVVEGQGLLKYERTDVTNADLDTWVPDPDQAKKVAPEVKSISFQYWDGSQWTTSWTSYDPTSDAPVGPPAGIEITIEMGGKNEGDKTRKYRQVISLPTGNNYSIQQSQ